MENSSLRASFYEFIFFLEQKKRQKIERRALLTRELRGELSRATRKAQTDWTRKRSLLDEYFAQPMVINKSSLVVKQTQRVLERPAMRSKLIFRFSMIIIMIIIIIKFIVTRMSFIVPQWGIFIVQSLVNMKASVAVYRRTLFDSSSLSLDEKRHMRLLPDQPNWLDDIKQAWDPTRFASLTSLYEAL